MSDNNINLVLDEVEKVIKGKREIIEKVFMAICASGHILLEDNPGSGKTTMAKAPHVSMQLWNLVSST